LILGVLSATNCQTSVGGDRYVEGVVLGDAYLAVTGSGQALAADSVAGAIVVVKIFMAVMIDGFEQVTASVVAMPLDKTVLVDGGGAVAVGVVFGDGGGRT
jgi:hypothetical protein